MKVVGLLVLSLGCSALLAGCSGSSDGGDDSGGGDESGVDWSKIDPPDNIDITTCASITENDDPDFFLCRDCCMGAGFPIASYLFDGHCICGNHHPDDRETVCMTAEAQASLNACSPCCNAAGYSGSVWANGTSCTCIAREDTTVCAGSVAGEASDEECFYCCLERGFLSATYANFGQEECSCVDP